VVELRGRQLVDDPADGAWELRVTEAS
jgi:hypothetical protein